LVVSARKKKIECMADRCNRYMLNSKPGDIEKQFRKISLFGKDNFRKINSIPDDSEIAKNSEVKLDLTPIRAPPPRRV